MNILDQKAAFDRAVSYSRAGKVGLANQEFRALHQVNRSDLSIILWLAETEHNAVEARAWLVKANNLAPGNPQVAVAWQKFNGRGKQPGPRSFRIFTGIVLLIIIFPVGLWYVLSDKELRPIFLWGILIFFALCVILGVAMKGF